MIRDNKVMLPKRKATKLKLNNPINPQFMAPTITIVSAKQFNVFIANLQLIIYKLITIFSLLCRKKFIHFIRLKRMMNINRESKEINMSEFFI